MDIDKEDNILSQSYVLGLAFTEDKRQVLLMEKNRPAWQAGFLNGIGGKVHVGTEYPAGAMPREAKEKADLDVKWNHFATMYGDDFMVYVFKAFDDAVKDFRQMGDEELRLVFVEDVQVAKTIDDIKYLVPAAVYGGREHLRLEYRVMGAV